MSLKVVGAGFGRTATNSLKLALEQLLGGPCYHMYEIMQHEEHVPLWHAAARGEQVDWDEIFKGYVATVDWPSGAYWKELSEAYPDSLILLSTRDPEKWWKSASETVFPSIMREEEEGRNRRLMVRETLANKFTMDLTNREACIAAFNAHNENVRRLAPPNRLVEWTASDGWGPLCKALNVPIPDDPFPQTNSTEEFVRTVRLDVEEGSGPQPRPLQR
jgi:hypothetical protein